MAFIIQKNKQYNLAISNICCLQSAAQEFHHQVWKLLNEWQFCSKKKLKLPEKMPGTVS